MRKSGPPRTKRAEKDPQRPVFFKKKVVLTKDVTIQSVINICKKINFWDRLHCEKPVEKDPQRHVHEKKSDVVLTKDVTI